MALLLTVATGAWADGDEPEPIDLTKNNDSTVWTLASMPAYDIELEVEYWEFTPATLTAAPEPATSALFEGQPLPLITTAGTAENGTLYYALGTAEAAPTEASAWSTDVPTATAAGVYYVWYKVLGDATHNSIAPAGPLTVTVKADITAADVTAPTVGENLQYRALPQYLVHAGSVNGDIGTMQYSLDGTTWSQYVPKGTDKGEYIVYYKVVGDAFHNDYVPAEGITVTIGEGAEMAARLTITGNTGTSCTANLLADTNTYESIEESRAKVGEKFILSTVNEDGYDFKVTNASMEEFTDAEYQAYFNYAKANNIPVSLRTSLLWVSMPYAESGNVNLTVEFQKQKSYTILYQPASGTNPKTVACKIERTVNNETQISYTAMQSGATMGDGKAVWTVNMQAAFAPTKIAFVQVAEETTSDALEQSLNSAAMTGATISQSAETWNSIGETKYLIIGNNAKVVTAAFVADGNSVTTYKDFQADLATTTGGVQYRLAVCATDALGNATTAGTVKAPAAPTAAEDMQFDGWRGYEYDNGRLVEKIFNAGADISVRGNMTLLAVWSPKQITTTFALNGGKDFSPTETTTTYGQKLNVSDKPKRSGLVFDRWIVAKAVNESGILFGRGSEFDMNTPLTANLNLIASWKHVHEYTYYRLSRFRDWLPGLQQYDSQMHIAVCGCEDLDIVDHEFNPAGRCACGYRKPGAPKKAELKVSYGELKDGNFTTFSYGIPQYAVRGEEVLVDAYHSWGNLEFQKWQYSTDGKTWEDLAAFEIVGFLIPCNMQVRALYANPVKTPTIELTTSHYDDKTEHQGQTYMMDNILYKMDYKLPDGYKLLDAGIRTGDNAGISYYFKQNVTYSLDAESKGIAAGIGAGVVGLEVLGAVFLNGNLWDAGTFAVDCTKGIFKEANDIIYLETEDNVMEKEKMTPATLAKRMYESTPINVKKYEPIYWEAQAKTKGLYGSLTALPPLRFAQKNNQDHYIYGIAYMRYETPDKQMKTLYTDALAPTANNPVCYTKKEEQPANARLMSLDLDETAAAARKAPKREPEPEQPAEQIDLSTVTAPQTQLVVYADGQYSDQLSDTYGYNETVSLTAPSVQGKTFSYWTTDGGEVITTSQELTLTMNANTKLRAVYGGEAKSAKPAITSITRTNDGNMFSVQAIAKGTYDEAGLLYSTTNPVPTIDDDASVTTSGSAMWYQDLPTTDSPENPKPASVLDKNKCWSLQITPGENNENTVYHVRAYTTNGGTTSYSEVKDVKLSSLKSGIMMVANVAAVDNARTDTLLAELKAAGKLPAGYAIEIAAGEYATHYNDKVLTLSAETAANAQLYTITAVNDDKATATALTVAAANTPLLVKNTTESTQTIMLIPTDDAADDVTVFPGFVGTLEDAQIAASTDAQTNYAFNGLQFVRVKYALPVAANKAWLEVPTSTARSIALVFADDDATAISAVSGSPADKAAVYDLSGRKVTNPAKKGVYIVNGKKVVVK